MRTDKRCACGKRFDAVSWATLVPIGIQDLGDGTVGELRNCTCGSTLCVALPLRAARPALLLDLAALFATEAAHEADEAERARLTGEAQRLFEHARVRTPARALRSSRPPSERPRAA